MMKYFETLSRETPTVVEAGSYVIISEVALIKDTVDNEILLRIVFANSSDHIVKAVAVEIHMWDVFGDEVLVDGSSVMNYIYQDISFPPQTMFGNKVPVHMPDSVRKVEVRITRVVFGNGTVWRSNPENLVHTQPQNLLEGTDEFAEQLVEDWVMYPPILTYEENEECWQCTCGGINKINDVRCFRCARSKEYCAKEFNADRIHKKFEDFKAAKEKAEEEARRVEEERQRQLEEERRIAQRKKEEEERIRREKEVEERRIWEENRRREFEEQKRRKRKRNRRITASVAMLVILAGGTFAYLKYLKPMMEYNSACQLMEKGSYQEAKEAFERLGDYQDSSELALNAEAEAVLVEADSLYEQGKLDEAYDVLTRLRSTGFSDEYFQKGLNKQNRIRYEQAVAYNEEGNYVKAFTTFNSIKDYEDSAELAKDAEYKAAQEYFNNGSYDVAYELFSELKDYKDSSPLAQEAAYAEGILRYDQGDYKAAADFLKECIDVHEDAVDLCYKAVYEAVSKADIVSIGKYEQDNDESNGGEVIRWKVLTKNNNQLFLVSEEPLELLKFSDTNQYSWKNSYIREWLNTDFYNGAFTEYERLRICPFKVIAQHRDGTEETTVDYITLPGKTTVTKYLTPKEWAFSISCDYLIAKTSSYSTSTCWLRDEGIHSTPDSCKICLLSAKGVIFSGAGPNPKSKRLIRPCMWIDCSEKGVTDGQAYSVIEIASLKSEKMAESSEKKTEEKNSASAKSSSSSSQGSSRKSSSSSSSGSGYGYDSSDPYYSSADHDKDGKLTDDEWAEAMGNAIADIANGTYSGGEVTPEMKELADAVMNYQG